MMKVLALATYPPGAACSRFRLFQFVSPLAERGITLDPRPQLDPGLFRLLYQRTSPRLAIGLVWSAVRRFVDLLDTRSFDAVFVQREAMLFGPPVCEYVVARLLRKPMVLDLDDPTYLSYVSGRGRLASYLKWFGKTDDLVRWADVVTCGNRTIAEYVAGKGAHALVIPTVVDLDRFRPGPEGIRSDPPVIGWIGSPPTYPYLETVFPVLRRLAQSHRFRLRIIGSGRDEVQVPGVDVENLPWSLEREVEDFQGLDIGLYPIVPDDWSMGKSGFKAIQYLAVGIPYVVSPVGTCDEIGEAGVTHFAATTEDQWYEALDRLLSEPELRRRMGRAGRQHALRHYSVDAQAEKLAGAIRWSVEIRRDRVGTSSRSVPTLRPPSGSSTHSSAEAALGTVPLGVVTPPTDNL
jgi:glycosyltransferase involved in cell wall biosynthesis